MTFIASKISFGTSASFSRCNSLIKTNKQLAYYSVYTWGYGAYGQLGHPFEKSLVGAYSELKPRLLESKMGDAVTYASCGATHTAMVTKDGSLWTWGQGKNGELGQGEVTDVLEPTKVESLQGVKIVAVACGDHHTLALDDKGQCYSCGWGGDIFSGCGGLGLGDKTDRNQFELIESLVEEEIEVTELSAGKQHSLFLTSEKEVYACGAGEYGRLGTGSTSDALVPEPVDFFDGMSPTVQIAAGHTFNMALNAEGKVHSWGRSDQGQLGLGGGFQMDVYNIEDMPTLVEDLEDEHIKHVAAGKAHAAAVTDAGELYMWGMKRYLEPHLMTELIKKHKQKVASVGCGENYTVALTDAGTLYSFGQGRTCCLGHGEKSTLPQPTLIKALVGKKVKSISCGNHHIAALVEDAS